MYYRNRKRIKGKKHIEVTQDISKFTSKQIEGNPYFLKDYLDVLDAICVRSVISNYKLLAIRLDVMIPNLPITDKEKAKRMTQVLNSLRKYMKRESDRYKTTDKFRYMGVKEYSKNNRLHYHFMFFLDGRIHRSPHVLYTKLKQYIASAFGLTSDNCDGYVHLNKNKYYDKVIHNRDSLREELFDMGLYLCKVQTKVFAKGNRNLLYKI